MRSRTRAHHTGAPTRRDGAPRRSSATQLGFEAEAIARHAAASRPRRQALGDDEARGGCRWRRSSSRADRRRIAATSAQPLTSISSARSARDRGRRARHCRCCPSSTSTTRQPFGPTWLASSPRPCGVPAQTIHGPSDGAAPSAAGGRRRRPTQRPVADRRIPQTARGPSPRIGRSRRAAVRRRPGPQPSGRRSRGELWASSAAPLIPRNVAKQRPSRLTDAADIAFGGKTVAPVASHGRYAAAAASSRLSAMKTSTPCAAQALETVAQRDAGAQARGVAAEQTAAQDQKCGVALDHQLDQRLPGAQRRRRAGSRAAGPAARECRAPAHRGADRPRVRSNTSHRRGRSAVRLHALAPFPRCSQAASTKARSHTMKFSTELLPLYGGIAAPHGRVVGWRVSGACCPVSARRKGPAPRARLRSEEHVHLRRPQTLVVAEVRPDAVADAIERAHLDEAGEKWLEADADAVLRVAALARQLDRPNRRSRTPP